MYRDTITIALEGDIRLDDFSKAIHTFTRLVEALTSEVAGETPIEWTVEDLQAGSAVATVRGRAAEIEPVERVVSAYTSAWAAAEAHQPIPYSHTVSKLTRDLTNMLDGHITAIRFETPLGKTVIQSPGVTGATSGDVVWSLGVIKGIVETLSSRRGLKFYLYDAIFDKSVLCYLQDDQRDVMRQAWGKLVAVSGRIGRHVDGGRPVAVKEIRAIRIVEPAQPGGYKRARGVLPISENVEPSDQVIRRLRDVG